MSVILVFLLAVAGIAVWWLSHQRLMSQPWLETNQAGDFIPSEQSAMPTAKIFLGVFLAVVGCLFALFTSAYFMRMELSDWRPLPMPGLLWFNTLVLVLSSVALSLALRAARQGDVRTARLGLITGGVTALGFLAGQLEAWRTLVVDGYLVAGNPANSFFYLITGLHGLHILGGLFGLARTIGKARDGTDTVALARSIDLVAMYFNFLLVVWFGLFVLFAGWAGDFIDICRQWLS
ncbi:MAG: cytochrome c oxidase subunit 3 [Mesorhizobium sp.]|jgi:cytochrome c oxidase subunit 3